MKNPVFHSQSRPKFVVESQDEFLQLWPNRYDYIYASHPKPGEKPEWETESRHPLSDRLIIQKGYLYGVRPGKESSYAMLDIDRGSPYHPARDRMALERIIEALEPLGLIAHLALTSSRSNGMHIYFPFSESLASWKIGLVVTALLENAGFKVMSGWLEVFPNRKPFAPSGEITLFNGHRLPLQHGSYLLNEKLEIIDSTQTAFLRQWNHVAARNIIDGPTLTRVIAQAVRKNYYVSGKAEKFLNDLNADIEPGWSGRGQTNFILGRIAMRSYIFGHVLNAIEPLSDDALVDDIIAVAVNLPGYQEFCNHQHDIESRAKEWARSVEGSNYYHYGNDSIKEKADSNEPSWNNKQSKSARERIQEAVVALFRANAWPEGITPRFDALCAAGIGGNTLYKNRDLWHPKHTPDDSIFGANNLPVENPPDPPTSQEGGVVDCARGASPTPTPTSLLGALDRNTFTINGSSDHSSNLQLPSDPPGSNLGPVYQPMSQIEGLRYIKEILRQKKAGPKGEHHAN